jgi:transposase
MSQQVLWVVLETKERLHREILHTAEPLQQEVKRLISIKGITPLTALAFLADVGDVTRFKSLRKMNAHLGLVPRVKESGGKSRSGHINRESRKLTRTILTQSIHHVSNSSPYLRRFYCDLTEKRGCGRARIALIRKVCSIMRRMLLTGEEFRWIEHGLFERKLKAYDKTLEEMREEEKKSA